MAQKRRGLGRGLQALIPEAQKEKVSASRPSDVFFPESRKDDAHEENTPSHAEAEHALEKLRENSAKWAEDDATENR